MRALFLALFGAAVLSVLVIRPASCADLVGVVTNSQGQPVGAVRIIVKNMTTNRVVREVQSKADGHYQVPGLDPGVYKYSIDPVGSGFKGGDAVSYLGPKGLTIDWQLSDANQAIALAGNNPGTTLATDPYGFTDAEFAGVVLGSGALVGGGVIGGLAASGAYSGSSTKPPASPSL